MNKLSKIILTSCLCGVGAASALTGAALISDASRQDVFADGIIMSVAAAEDVFDEVYAYGTEISLPQSVVLLVNGNEEVMSEKTYIRYPDGRVYDVLPGKLSTEGEYVVTYKAKYNGTYVTADETFTVKKDGYYVSSDKSEVEFKQLTLSNLSKAPEGLSVTLYEGDKLYFMKTINLNDVDLLDVCRIFPYLKDDRAAKPSVNFVTVKLVDCYDENKFIEFYNWSQISNGVYVGCGTESQKIGGLESYAATGAATDVIYNGQNYRFHQSERYSSGAVYGASSQVAAVSGESFNVTFAKSGGMNFEFNPKTGDVYKYKYDENDKKFSKNFVNNICSQELHGVNAFGGFTTGECYAVIECFGYSQSTVNLEIQSLMGYSGEDLKASDFTYCKPLVDLSVQATSDNTVNIVKGQAFTLPTVSVNSPVYAGNLKTALYANYGTEEQNAVYFKDGVFVPEKTGYYTVVYDITDMFGVLDRRTLGLNVVEAEAGIVFNVGQSKFGYYEPVNFAQPEIQNINGDVSVKIEITAPSGETVVLDSEQGYLPTELGEYKVKYIYADNVYDGTYEYTAECVKSSTVHFEDVDANLPERYIKGATYKAEQRYAYYQGERLKVNAYVSFDGGEYVAITGNDFTVNAENSVRFKYECNGSYAESKTVAVKDVGYSSNEKNYAAHFEGDYVSTTTSVDGHLYVFDGTKTSATLKFINRISFEDFELGFYIPASQSNFAKVVISLSDGSDETVIEYVNKNGGLYYGVNGVYDDVKGVNFSDVSHSVWVAYDDGKITNNQKVSRSFGDYASKMCSLTITLEGITGESAIRINKINNQNVSDAMSDAVPQISYNSPEGLYTLGETFTVAVPIVSSVYNPVASDGIKLTVKSPDGGIANDVYGHAINDVVMTDDVKVKLEKSGKYIVIYEYEVKTKLSGAVKKGTKRFVVNVTDNVAPTIRFTGKIDADTVISVKLNSEYVVEGYEYSDNETAKEDLNTYIYVYDEAGRIVKYNQSKMTFTTKGVYTVKICCYDADGNSAYITYKVKAE